MVGGESSAVASFCHTNIHIYNSKYIYVYIIVNTLSMINAERREYYILR